MAHETSPAVITITLPVDINSTKVGQQLQEAGFLLSYNSEYLRQRNWLQICLMGEFAKEKLVSLLNHLTASASAVLNRRPQCLLLRPQRRR